MKKTATILLTALLLFNTKPVKAMELHTAKATAYCLNGITATGTTVKEGRTVASKPEWFNKTMIMYEDDGDGIIKPSNYIGTYIVEDTGGQTIKSGMVIDVYISDYLRAKEFGCKDVIFLIIEAEG